MKKISEFLGNKLITIRNCKTFLNAWRDGKITVGRYPNRMRNRCENLYKWCLFYHERKITTINLATVYESKKRKELKGFGDWCIMSIAKFRCKAECWVPKDSRIRKNMILLGMMNQHEKNNDKFAVRTFIINEQHLKKKGLNIYFHSSLSKEFDRIHAYHHNKHKKK